MRWWGRRPIGRRLREHGAVEGTPAARAGQIIRALPAPARLDAAAHARILRRLDAVEDVGAEALPAREARAVPRRRPPSLMSRAAFAAMLAAVVVLAGIAANAAVSWIKTGRLPWTRSAAPAPSARAASRAPRHAGAHHAGGPGDDDQLAGETEADGTVAGAPAAPDGPGLGLPALPPLPAPPPAAAPQAAPVAAGPPAAPLSAPAAPPGRTHATSDRRALALAGPAGAAQARAPAAAPGPAAAPEEPSLLAQESRVLTHVLDLLRTSHDYAGALATLDDYDARFPRGVLRREAAFARLDALTALGRTGQALALLDGIQIGGPRAIELLVLRGELRGAAHRYREAIDDFDRALARRTTPALSERALYGRASCRSGAGDAAGAMQDLQGYLASFPQGVHAAEVRRRLAR
jgi:hypothetical protein